MCNQLPSSSISTASQILGLLVSLADSDRSLARQPSEASVKPDRCHKTGNSVTPCASHFIYVQYDFVSTNTLDTPRQRKVNFCMPICLTPSREYITKLFWVSYFFIVLKKNKCLKLSLYNDVSCTFHHAVASPPPTSP